MIKLATTAHHVITMCFIDVPDHDKVGTLVGRTSQPGFMFSLHAKVTDSDHLESRSPFVNCYNGISPQPIQIAMANY